MRAIEIRKTGGTGGPREKFHDEEKSYNDKGVSSDDSSSSSTLMRI
jgi:hypothetical protein